MSSVLITGGAGFIGSNLTDALVSEGRECHVVDNLSNGKAIRLPDEAELHETDIRSAAELVALATRTRPSTIFHLAAQADVRKAMEDPGYDADVNVIGTVNVLEAARAVGARVVFSSTGGAGYGEYVGLPVPSPETAETRPLSHYGMSKMAGEGYCHLYGRLYGSATSVLRLGNVYGPRQDPHGEAGVVAIFCGRMLDGVRPKVFGDGLQTRDYVYVADVVGAFLAAESGEPGETVNIGAGVEVTVLDLLEGLGYEGDPEFAEARAGELQRSVLDVSKVERLYGWRARTPLREGLQATLASVIAARREPDARPPGPFRRRDPGGANGAAPQDRHRALLHHPGERLGIDADRIGGGLPAGVEARRAPWPRRMGVGRQHVRGAPAKEGHGRPLGGRPVSSEEGARGDLNERSTADEVAQAVGPALDGLGALRVGEHRAEATDLQVAERLDEAEGPSPEGHLQQQPSAATADARHREVLVAHAPDPGERDLGARVEGQRDPLLLECRAQACDAAMHLLRVGGVPLDHVGGADHAERARLPCRSRHGDRFGEGRRTVVDARQQVSVEVDHAALRVAPMAEEPHPGLTESRARDTVVLTVGH